MAVTSNFDIFYTFFYAFFQFEFWLERIIGQNMDHFAFIIIDLVRKCYLLPRILCLMLPYLFPFLQYSIFNYSILGQLQWIIHQISNWLHPNDGLSPLNPYSSFRITSDTPQNISDSCPALLCCMLIAGCVIPVSLRW